MKDGWKIQPIRSMYNVMTSNKWNNIFWILFTRIWIRTNIHSPCTVLLFTNRRNARLNAIFTYVHTHVQMHRVSLSSIRFTILFRKSRTTCFNAWISFRFPTHVNKGFLGAIFIATVIHLTMIVNCSKSEQTIWAEFLVAETK